MENMSYPSDVRDAIKKWEQEHKGYVAFTQWCDVYESELAHLSKLSKDTKRKIAFMLLEYMGISQSDWASQYALLKDASETAYHMSEIRF